MEETYGFKSYKDPIYGYIRIPDPYFSAIIDTPAFQRLRLITQTSYSPLYSSATHNRFTHSIGVYHLGCLAADTLKKELLRKYDYENPESHYFYLKDGIERADIVFRYACLLHDVGHAPFSHTGEHYYVVAVGSFEKLETMLEESIGPGVVLRNKTTNAMHFAAEHEIMSALVGVRKFANLFEPGGKDNREFFARAITGYTYSTEDDDRYLLNDIRNCYISLLNSTTIDVDKLDYLIRDAYQSGYEAVGIDYQRLLGTITIYEEEKKSGSELKITYKKNALSVLENALYAHDFEKKWIQTHPVVQYDLQLLKHVISATCKKLDYSEEEKGGKLFSYEALTEEGVTLRDGNRVRLLSDDDIIGFAKSHLYDDPVCREYFDRNARMHPVWKPEPEFIVYFEGLSKGADLATIQDRFRDIYESCRKSSDAQNELVRLNADLLENMKKNLSEMQNAREANGKTTKSLYTAERTLKRNIRLMSALERCSRDNVIDFDYVLLNSVVFSSGFNKNDFQQMRILFDLESPY